MSPNKQNSERGIETDATSYQPLYSVSGPNKQNSERGIETGFGRGVCLGRRSGPNKQNSERGIETSAVVKVGQVRAQSEQTEFRAGN